jgi:hypothetical protein
MAWMDELSRRPPRLERDGCDPGGLGLFLPSLTRIAPRLTPLAALGLVLIMADAIVRHLGRGDSASIVMNLTLAILAAFVAYGRWHLNPISARSPA